MLHLHGLIALHLHVVVALCVVVLIPKFDNTLCDPKIVVLSVGIRLPRQCSGSICNYCVVGLNVSMLLNFFLAFGTLQLLLSLRLDGLCVRCTKYCFSYIITSKTVVFFTLTNFVGIRQ